MGDWTEFLIDENGIEITVEGYILGSDSSAVELSVLKQVGEGEDWSYEKSDEFLGILRGVDSEFDGAENLSNEDCYHVVTSARKVAGGEQGVGVEIERLKGIAARVFAVIA